MRLSIAIITDAPNSKEFCGNIDELRELSKRDSYKMLILKEFGGKQETKKTGKLYMIPFVTANQLNFFETTQRMVVLKNSEHLFSIVSTEIMILKTTKHDLSPLNHVPIEIESIYFTVPESFLILPSCPVCFKRLDKSISGFNSINCRDLFHSCCRENCQEISKNCSVCQIINDTETRHECSDCASTENIWICLICANIGCGRYKGGHAHNHFIRTGHAFALKIDLHHIWDYSLDKYVHWSIKSDSGTVVDVDDDIKVSENNRDSLRPTEEFNFDFTTAQLESQKAFFEERLVAFKNEKQHEIINLKCENDAVILKLKDEVHRLTRDCKIFTDLSNQFKEQLKKFKEQNESLKRDLETERKISLGLSANYDQLKTTLTVSQAEKDDLEDQVKDLMKHIEVLDLMAKAGNNSDIVEGKLLIRPMNKKKFK